MGMTSQIQVNTGGGWEDLDGKGPPVSRRCLTGAIRWR
jgi:hypothetical protein